MLTNMLTDELVCYSLNVSPQFNMHFTARQEKSPQNQYSNKPNFIKGHAMIDSGASSCFISKDLVKSHKLQTYPLKYTKKLNVIDGREISSRQVTEGCNLEFSIDNHTEEISCYVVELGHHHIILRMSWLKIHSPTIDWKEETVTFISPYCQKSCLRHNPVVPVNQKEPKFDISAIAGLPLEYQEFSDIFKEDEETPLPPHREYDLAIELEPGSKPKWGPLYNLGKLEDEELKKSLERWLRQGFIRVSKSPMASPVLFVKKKNRKFRMCVDF